MSFALFQIPEVQQLIAYLEGTGGDLSGDFDDVPMDNWMSDYEMQAPALDLKEKVNFCLRAAYNDYHNVDPRLTTEKIEMIGDTIIIDLITDARTRLQSHVSVLRKAGYIVSTLNYPLVVSNAGDTIIEVNDHVQL